jgi:hypothetical protein
VSVFEKYGSAMFGMAIRKWFVRLIEDMLRPHFSAPGLEQRAARKF